MSRRTTLTRAASIIERHARALKECETLDGKWPEDDPGAEREYKSMTKTAREQELRRPIPGRDDDVRWR